MNDANDYYDKSVDQVFSIVQIFKLVSNIDKFLVWVKNKHPEQDEGLLFDGYRFFLMSTINALLYSIDYNNSLGIEEDIVMHRTRFADGITIDRIPTTCAKLAILRNLWDMGRPIRKARNFDELKGAIAKFNEEIISIFDDISTRYVSVNPKFGLSKEISLKYDTLFYTVTFFNDAEKQVPKAYTLFLLDYRINPKELPKMFDGYKYTLVFLWTLLLDKEQLSTIENLDKTEGWNTWESDRDKGIDGYFGKIYDEIISPIDGKLGRGKIGSELLLLDDEFTEATFKTLLTPVEVKPELSEEEMFQYKLLWYPTEVLGLEKSIQGGEIFNGVPAFSTILTGQCELPKDLRGGKKVYASKFLHYDKQANGYDYSYGVLITAFGALSDSSGWIILFDCATDYSGFGGDLHDEAERVIKKYENEGLVEVREMKISKDKFKECVVDRLVGLSQREVLDERFALRTKEKEYEDYRSNAKGLIIELLTYFYESKLYESKTKEKIISIDWGKDSGSTEKDVIIKTTNSLILLECKFNPQTMNLDAEIEKVKIKLNAYATDKQKRAGFAVWMHPSRITSSRISENGMDCVVIGDRIGPFVERYTLKRIKKVLEPGFKEDEEEWV